MAAVVAGLLGGCADTDELTAGEFCRAWADLEAQTADDAPSRLLRRLLATAPEEIDDQVGAYAAALTGRGELPADPREDIEAWVSEHC